MTLSPLPAYPGSELIDGAVQAYQDTHVIAMRTIMKYRMNTLRVFLSALRLFMIMRGIKNLDDYREKARWGHAQLHINLSNWALYTPPEPHQCFGEQMQPHSNGNRVSTF